MYVSSFTGLETRSQAWLLPHDEITDTACIEVVRDAVGVVVTLSFDLPVDTDTDTPAAALDALTVALSALAAAMRGGASW